MMSKPATDLYIKGYNIATFLSVAGSTVPFICLPLECVIIIFLIGVCY